MSSSGIMMDERYFPDPREFNPENFHPDNKMDRGDTYMTSAKLWEF